MNLLEKRDYFQAKREELPSNIKEQYEREFNLNYNHHSTAIENNTLTKEETVSILTNPEKPEVKDNREAHEIINHNKAFAYVKDCVTSGKKLNENIIKEIHRLLMENIMVGSAYRMINVFIPGAKYTPPKPNQAEIDLKKFYYKIEEEMDPIELAAYTHTEFLRIHPFIDGNGRTSRLLLNYQLLSKGFLPINIKRSERDEYYSLINEYAVTGNLEPFINFITKQLGEDLDKYLKIIQDNKDLTKE